MLLVGMPDLVLELRLLDVWEREELELLLLPWACGSAAADPRMLKAASEAATVLQLHASILEVYVCVRRCYVTALSDF